MHEQKLAQSIVETVVCVARERGFSRITEIRLKVGEFTCVQPDMLRFCLTVLAEGTAAENAAILIRRTRTRALCEGCGLEFDVDDSRFRCPRCDSADVALSSGRELEIDSIEVE